MIRLRQVLTNPTLLYLPPVRVWVKPRSFLNIATNVARRSGKDVTVFSLEMSKEQLATRMLSTEALVDSNKLRSGFLSDNDWVRLASSADVLCGMPLYLDDTAGTTVKANKKQSSDV